MKVEVRGTKEVQPTGRSDGGGVGSKRAEGCVTLGFLFLWVVRVRLRI